MKFSNVAKALAIGLVLPLLSGCQIGGPPKASLAASETGYFSFPTTTPWNGRNTPIGGTLSLPDDGAGPFSTIVLVHSGDGIDYSETQWERHYLRHGYAVFMLDYMAPRGVGRANTRRYPRGGYDVVDAVKVLSTHPRLDKDRFAVQGFSNGGTVTAASVTIFEGEDEVPTPRAFILTYGGCSQIGRLSIGTRMPEDATYLFLVGSEDKTVIPESCVRAAKLLNERNVDATAILFPGVYHGFDDIESKVVSTKWGTQVMQPDSAATEASYREALAALKRAFN